MSTRNRSSLKLDPEPIVSEFQVVQKVKYQVIFSILFNSDWVGWVSTPKCDWDTPKGMVLDYVPGSTFQLHNSHNRNFFAFEAHGSLHGFIRCFEQIMSNPDKLRIRSSTTCSLLGHNHILSSINIYSYIFILFTTLIHIFMLHALGT